jgi:homoserine O-acetyltransferase
MGSFQGIEWGIAYPDFMRGLLLWVPAARSDRHFQVIMDAVEATITLDPAYKAGRYDQQPVEGMRRAGVIYFPWLFSDAHLRSLSNEAEYDKAKWSFGEGWARLWDANTLLWRYRASRNHDASAPFGGDMKAALVKVTAPALVLASTSDRTVPGYLDEIVQGLRHVTYAPINSDRGHLAYLAQEGTREYAQISWQTGGFLKQLQVKSGAGR